MILNIISCIGITIIVTQSSLFEKLRDWVSFYSKFLGELINCPLCFGVWVGFFASFIFNCNPIHLAFATSVCAWMTSIIGNLLITVSYYFDTDNNGE